MRELRKKQEPEKIFIDESVSCKEIGMKEKESVMEETTVIHGNNEDDSSSDEFKDPTDRTNHTFVKIKILKPKEDLFYLEEAKKNKGMCEYSYNYRMGLLVIGFFDPKYLQEFLYSEGMKGVKSIETY